MSKHPEEFLSEAELMEPSTWDMESAVSNPPLKAHESVISVKFNCTEFSEIASAARENGLPIVQYIRLSALARSRGQDQLESK